MSQCHDIYEPIAAGPVPDDGAEPQSLDGAQCHDTYEWKSPPGRATELGQECQLLDSCRRGVQVKRVVGRLDWSIEGRFFDFVRKASQPDVLVDLSAATTDSAGTGAVLSGALWA